MFVIQVLVVWLFPLSSRLCVCLIFKPPPPVGAGGGYMFSGRPSVPLSMRASVIHVVVLCFRDISSICWLIFAKLLSLVHLGTEMNWLDFGVKRSKFKVTAWPNASQIFMFPLYLQYLLIDFRQTFVTGASLVLPSSATFSSCLFVGGIILKFWMNFCEIFGWRAKLRDCFIYISDNYLDLGSFLFACFYSY